MGANDEIEKVGFMTPGDMGQAVAMQIKARGFTVCTALNNRSERSRKLAREAGLTDVGTIARLIEECDVVLSVMNPGAAVDFAREAAQALRASGRHTLIADTRSAAARRSWRRSRSSAARRDASAHPAHALPAQALPVC